MANNNTSRSSGGSRDQYISEMISKYSKLFWKKKYWIIGITVGVSILWFIFFSLFLNEEMEYTSSVTIKFDEPRQTTNAQAVTDFAQFGSEGKVAILKTNSFLAQVVDSLHLNLVLRTPGINRFDFFKRIDLSKDSKLGLYKLVLADDQLAVYYTNEMEEITGQEIHTQPFESLAEVDLTFNGIHMVVDAGILMEFKEVDFSCSTVLQTTNALQQKMVGNLDRSGTILTIQFTYNNPHATAQIANTIASMFINKLLEHKKYRTSSILSSLEGQLKAADQSLKQSEEALSRYRERNPYLLLSDGGSSLVTNLADKRKELDQVKMRLSRISYFQEQKATAAKENIRLIYLQLIAFAEAENLARDNIITSQYRELAEDITRLKADGYTSGHPRIKEIEEKLADLEIKIDDRVNNYIKELSAAQTKLETEINSDSHNLKRLPRGEIRLAELEQDREVKAQIYSNVLVRYNEAKIADASIIADAFIIDHAEVPIVYSEFINTLIQLLIGPFLGLMLSIGVLVFLDFLDDSVTKRDEVEQILRLPVLSNIPVIFDEKEYPDEIYVNGQLDYKLITSDYSPTIASEKFRLLRTKLIQQADGGKKTFIMTSLTPGDGKSLIAANLAITFAQQKIPTLLIDADLRRGVMHSTFNRRKKPGLSDLLVSNNPASVEEIAGVIQQTHVPYLSLIPCGLQIPNPSELLGGTQMRRLLEKFEREFEVILFDTPPIEYIPDALVLNMLVKNVILVVRYGRTRLGKIANKMTELTNIKNDFSGVVINASQERLMNEQYSYSYYHY